MADVQIENTGPMIGQANHFANVARWINAIAARPAVQKGMAVPQV